MNPFENLGDTLTRKYGPLPGYAWVGAGAGVIVLAGVLLRRGGGAGGSSTAGRSFLTLPPQGDVTGAGSAGDTGAPGEATTPVGSVLPSIVEPAAQDAGPVLDLGGSSGETDAAVAAFFANDGGSAGSTQPPAILTAEPLPQLAPYADALVARGIDPSTGGLLPGAGAGGNAGAPIAYGPGLFNDTPTVATAQGPVPGGVFRAAILEDPFAFAPTAPAYSSAAVVADTYTPAAAQSYADVSIAPAPAPPAESLLEMHHRLGRDPMDG